jgi:hypothetical protein
MNLWFWHVSWLIDEPYGDSFFLHCFFQVCASTFPVNYGFSQTGVCPCCWWLDHVTIVVVILTDFVVGPHLSQSIFLGPSLVGHCHP